MCLASCWGLDIQQEEQRSVRLGSPLCGLLGYLAIDIFLPHGSSLLIQIVTRRLCCSPGVEMKSLWPVPGLQSTKKQTK